MLCGDPSRSSAIDRRHADADCSIARTPRLAQIRHHRSLEPDHISPAGSDSVHIFTVRCDMELSATLMETPPNRLLAALPNDELERLRPHLQPVVVSARQVIHEPDEPIRHVYFVNRGIVSFVMVLEDGFQIEVAMAGSEGMIGAGVVL